MRFYYDRQRHLICVPYSVENLHLMAAELNIARCWFHGGKHPHYDVPKGRLSTMDQHATLVTPRELLRLMWYSPTAT